MAAALKKSENALDGDVQNALSKLTATKLLQSDTSRHANARDAPRKAKKARQNLHKNWRKFLADAVTRWQQHSENYSKEEAAIAEANATFQSARTHLEETKEALIEFDSATGEVQEVSDDENMPDAAPTLSDEAVNSLTRLRDQHDESAEQRVIAASKCSKKVVFGPTVRVFVGSANDLKMAEFEFQFDRLGEWTAKPWSIRRAMPLVVEEPLPLTVLSPTASLLDPSQSQLIDESNSSDTSSDLDFLALQPLAMEDAPVGSGPSDMPASSSNANFGFLAPA
eukprot:s2481_g16.t1